MEQLQLIRLPQIFDFCMDSWHSEPDDYRVAGIGLNPLAFELVRRNYLLWHEEDTARRTDVDDGLIAAVKRKIDTLNQQRNDFIEKLDEQILDYIAGQAPVSVADEFNSETPGSIVDRISILSLKIYHMGEDAQRADIQPEHRERSLQRLAILREQRDDLNMSLGKLFDEYLAGRKKMKIYRQFKMYNDPTLNPEIYRAKQN